MKKIVALVAAAFLHFGGILILEGCQSQPVTEEVLAKNTEPKYDLLAVQKEADEQAEYLANPEEWKVFIEEHTAQIQSNENQIAALNRYAEITENRLDTSYLAKVDSFKRVNAKLRLRIMRFEKRQSDWESMHIEAKKEKPEDDKSM